MFNTVLPEKVLHFGLVSMLVFYLTGCGMSNRTVIPPENSQPGILAMDVSSPAINKSSVQKQLQGAHSEWKGTPYVLGGDGSNGVDCSAFTKIVFRDFLNKELPRHTKSQLQAGTGVRRRAIQSGDLIFFRTGKGTLHVGISMGNGDFLHASVSSGVMISNIKERYWAARYLGARRVL